MQPYNHFARSELTLIDLKEMAGDLERRIAKGPPPKESETKQQYDARCAVFKAENRGLLKLVRYAINNWSDGKILWNPCRQ